jgi:hypothetical protein
MAGDMGSGLDDPPDKPLDNPLHVFSLYIELTSRCRGGCKPGIRS